MLASDIFTPDLKFNEKLLKLGFSSRSEIEKYYKKTGPLKCFNAVIVDLVNSVQVKKLDNVKPLGQFLVQLSKIEKKDALQKFVNHEDCPIRQTNLIILACKHGETDILDYLLNKNNKLLNSLSVDIGRIPIDPFDEDEEGKNAFYYSIRSNDVNLLETLINKWPHSIDNEKLDELLAKAYRRLHLYNLDLNEDMKFFVENKLLTIRFYKENFSATKRSEVSLDDVKERANFVINVIENLVQNNDDRDQTVNEKFIFNLRSLNANIYALKRQLKSTYDRLPWEEIHFCLVVFVRNFNVKEDDGIFYRSYITKYKILKYLEEFGKHLKEVINKLKVGNINHVIDGNIIREEVIEKLSLVSEVFKNLYADYSKVRDFYTLEKITYFIDLVMNSSIENKEHEFLLIERCLQVIGENVKNTLNSPNLSTDLGNILTLTFPDDTRKVISDLRNSLSKKFSLTRRGEMKTGNKFYYESFKGIKEDLSRLRDFIGNIFGQYKTKLLDQLIEDIFNCKNYREFWKICEIFNWGRVNVVSPGLILANEEEKLKQLITKLSEKVPEKTTLQTKLFSKIFEMIEKKQNMKEKTLANYDIRLHTLKILISSEKDAFRHERRPRSIFDHLKVLKNTYSLLVPKNQDTDPDLPLALQKFKNPEKVSASLRKLIGTLDTRLFDNHDFMVIIQELLFLSSANSKNIKAIRELKEKFSPGKKSQKKMKKSSTIPDTDFVLEKIQLLDSILDDRKLLANDLDLIRNFVQNSHNRSIMVVIEMLLMDILSLNDDKVNDNVYFLDEELPLLIGKELRHHIAHGNFICDIMPFNIELSIITNSINYIQHYKSGLTVQQQTKIVATVPNLYEICKRFTNDSKIIEMNLEFFKMAEESSLSDIKNVIDLSLIDYYARDLKNYSLLEIAAKNHDLEVFVHFLKECPVFDFSVRKNDFKQNVFHLAASKGNHSIIDFVIQKSKSKFKAKSLQLLSESDYSKKNCLHYAVISGSYDMVNYLLGTNSESVQSADQFDSRPIHIAIHLNNLKNFKLLMKCEDQVDGNRYKGGYTFLHLAAESGRFDIVQFLIKRGADVNASNDGGWTPMHAASLLGHYEIVELLLKNGAKVDSKLLNDNEPLHFAIEKSHRNIVKLLIEHGADVNAREGVGKNTALLCACLENCTEIIKDLLDQGADPCCENADNSTPLHIAVEKDNEEIVRCLLKYNQIEVNAVDNGFQTPLHLASGSRNSNIFELLLELGADLDKKDASDLTPFQRAFLYNNFDVLSVVKKHNISISGVEYLRIAVKIDNLELTKYLFSKEPHISVETKNELLAISINAEKIETCRYLIDKGANVNAIFESIPLLYAAVTTENIEIVQLLINSGANPNVKVLGGTALEMLLQVLSDPDIEIVKSLVDAGCDINSVTAHGTPLISAIQLHRRDIVKLLLDRGADVNLKYPILFSLMLRDTTITKILLQHPKIDVTVTGADGGSILDLAAKYADSTIVKTLIAKGCDVNAGANKKFIPLHLATVEGQLSVLEVLVANGADLNAKTIEGATALHIAAENDACSILEFLIKRGAKFCRTDMGETPLHFAVRYGSYDCVEFLVKHKIDLNDTGRHGLTPLHVAAQIDFLAAAKLLLENGADPNIQNNFGSKSVHVAAREGSLDTLKYLIESGFNTVSEIGMNRQTLLHYAVGYPNYDVVDYLLSVGCDLNVADENGCYPLQFAARYTTREMCEFLLDRGSYFDIGMVLYREVFKPENEKFLTLIGQLFSAVHENNEREVEILLNSKWESPYSNAKNTNGQTVLHLAVQQENTQIVELLLNANASINLHDTLGNTALHLAAKLNNLQLTKKLLESGAIFNCTNYKSEKPIDVTKNSEIKNLLKLITKFFGLIEQKNDKIVNELKNVRNFNEIKIQIVKAKNSDGDTLLACAIKNNFPKFKELKEQFVGNDAADCLNEDACVAREDYDAAIKICQKTVERYGEILGYDNPETLKKQKQVVMYIYKKHGYQEALESNEKIYEKQRIILGDRNPDVLHTQSFKALILYRLGRHEESLKLCQDVLKMQKTVLDSETHKDITDTMTNMALVLEKLQRFDEALEINNNLLAISERKHGRKHPLTLVILNNIALIYLNQKKYFDAIDLFDFVYKARYITLGPNHSDTLRAIQNKVDALIGLKRFDDAVNEYTKIYNKQKKTLSENHADALNTKFRIARVKFEQGNYIEMLQVINEIYEKYKRIHGRDHPNVKIMDFWKLSSTMITNSQFTGDNFDLSQDMLGMFTEGLKSKAKDGKTEDHLYQRLFEAIANADQGDVLECLRINPNAIKFEDKDGNSPLQLAVYLGKKPIVDLLLKKGSNVLQKTQKGNTLLHLAVNKGHLNVCESVVKFMNASKPQKLSELLNAKTFLGGKTALHVATMKGNEKMTFFLLQSGAIYNQNDSLKKTPKDLSTNPEVTNLLEKIDEIFKAAKNGESRMLNKLEQMRRDEFTAVTNTKNCMGQNLSQLTLKSGNKILAIALIKLIKVNSG